MRVTVQWLNIKPVFMFLFCSLICTWTHEKTCWLYLKYVHLIGCFSVKISLGHSTIEEPFGIKWITKISILRFNFLVLTTRLLLLLDLLHTVPQCDYVTLPVCTCSIVCFPEGFGQHLPWQFLAAHLGMHLSPCFYLQSTFILARLLNTTSSATLQLRTTHKYFTSEGHRHADIHVVWRESWFF